MMTATIKGTSESYDMRKREKVGGVDVSDRVQIRKATAVVGTVKKIFIL